jgi:hypothetical protein
MITIIKILQKTVFGKYFFLNLIQLFFWAPFCGGETPPQKPGFPLQFLGPPYGGPAGFRPAAFIYARSFSEPLARKPC